MFSVVCICVAVERLKAIFFVSRGRDGGDGMRPFGVGIDRGNTQALLL